MPSTRAKSTKFVRDDVNICACARSAEDPALGAQRLSPSCQGENQQEHLGACPDMSVMWNKRLMGIAIVRGDGHVLVVDRNTLQDLVCGAASPSWARPGVGATRNGIRV